MSDRISLKAAVIGALSGAIVFLALCGVRAQQGPGISVADLRHNPKPYVGTVVSVTGMANSVRSGEKWNGHEKVPCIKLNLYEVDAKGRKGSHYIYVNMPTSQYKFVPAEGQMVQITGPLKWPYEVAAIDL